MCTSDACASLIQLRLLFRASQMRQPYNHLGINFARKRKPAATSLHYLFNKMLWSSNSFSWKILNVTSDPCDERKTVNTVLEHQFSLVDCCRTCECPVALCSFCHFGSDTSPLRCKSSKGCDHMEASCFQHAPVLGLQKFWTSTFVISLRNECATLYCITVVDMDMEWISIVSNKNILQSN